MKRILYLIIVLLWPTMVLAQSNFGNNKVQAGATCPPVAAPLSGAGTLYTCTGTGALYTWTGSAWSAVGSGTGTLSGTIANTQVAVGSGADTIGGSAGFTQDSNGNVVLVSSSSSTTDYLLNVDSESSSASGAEQFYPRMFHSIFNMNGTGTIVNKRVIPLDGEVFNNSTGRIDWSSSAELYAENISTGTWGTMIGGAARLFNDDSATVSEMVGFQTSPASHFANGNYGGGTVTSYTAFEGNSVNDNGTYGAVYGLHLTSQAGLTVTGNNHAINYNDTFIVDSTGAIYNGINSSQLVDVDASAFTAPALAGTGAGNVSNGAHRYKITVENTGGTVHTAGGAATVAVTVVNNAVNGKVIVSTPAYCFSSTDVNRVRVYRDKNTDGVYKLVGTANDTNCARDFIDDVADGSLGVTIPTTNNTEAQILSLSDASLGGPIQAFGNHKIPLLNQPDASFASSEFQYYYIFPQDRQTANTPHMGVAIFGNQNDVPGGAGMYNTEGGHLLLQGGAESTGGYGSLCGGAAFPGTVGSGSYTDALEGGCLTAYGSTATDAGRIEIVSGVAFAGAAANLNGGNVLIESGAPANGGHYGDLTMDLWRNVKVSGSGTLKIEGLVAPAGSGTRFLCIDPSGVISSSASACSGT